MKLIKKKSISNTDLKQRIALNSKFQKINFISWQKAKYKKILLNHFKKKKNNIKILDIGCGTGIQTAIFINFFRKPKILSTDISLKSLLQLKKKYPQNYVKIKKLDMNKLKSFFYKKNKSINKYDLIHSSYSLYYASKPKKILNELFSVLEKNGVFLVSAPDEPHEMVNFIKRNAFVSNRVLKTLKFYKKILLPFLIRKAKGKITTYKKINLIKFDNINSFVKFWKSTTYYNKKYNSKIIERLKNHSLNFKKISAIASIKKN